MRNRSLGIVFLTCLGLSASMTCGQESADNHRGGDAQTAPKGASASPKTVENWTALEDIKSGLQLYAPLDLQTDEQPEFVRELVRLQWRAGDPIDAWIMRPKTKAKVPVVLFLYSYPADPEQFRDNEWCKRATADGFAAIGFVSALTGPRYRLRPMKEWFVSELPEALGSSVHDVQLILNYLAARGDLDMDRVGMFGMGSGATIAILAAHTDPRIRTLDLMDPWGDWPNWLRESPAVPESERASYVTETFLKSVAPFEPIDYLPSLKVNSLRLEQTLNEPVTPASAKTRIANSLRDPSQLVKYTNPEEHFRAWQVSGMSGWIKQQLRAQGINKPDPKNNPEIKDSRKIGGSEGDLRPLCFHADRLGCKKMKIREGRVIGLSTVIGKTIGDEPRRMPFRHVLGNPNREMSVAHVGGLGEGIVVARVDDHITPGMRKQGAHVRIKNRILDQMIDNVERERQVEAGKLLGKCIGQIELLGRVLNEAGTASFDGRGSDVDADVFGILRQFQLRAIPTT